MITLIEEGIKMKKREFWNFGVQTDPNKSFFSELSEKESLEYRKNINEEEKQLRVELNFDVDDICPIDYATFNL